MREWADDENIIPPLQNGFRTGYRTENNIFTLRTVIDQARAHNETVWVAFVDLTNAFPSVDQSVLWAKLRAWGAGGPLFDWMRMLYDRMQYIVRFNGEYSAYFQSLAGILIGDPASPVLWNLFFADFKCKPHPDDVFLGDTWIPYLARRRSCDNRSVVSGTETSAMHGKVRPPTNPDRQPRARQRIHSPVLIALDGR